MLILLETRPLADRQRDIPLTLDLQQFPGVARDNQPSLYRRLKRNTDPQLWPLKNLHG